MPTHFYTTRIILGLASLLLGFGMGELLATDAPAAPVLPVPAATTPASTPATSQPATAPRPKLKDEDVALNFLKQHEPEVYQDALILRDKDQKKYNDLIKEFIPEVRGLIEMQKRQPAYFELVVKDRRLAYRTIQMAKELRDAPLTPEARESRTKDLKDLVTRQFAVRQQKRQMELDELQRKLDDLKHQLDDREHNKDGLISQRITDLLKKNPRVEW